MITSLDCDRADVKTLSFSGKFCPKQIILDARSSMDMSMKEVEEYCNCHDTNWKRDTEWFPQVHPAKCIIPQ